VIHRHPVRGAVLAALVTAVAVLPSPAVAELVPPPKPLLEGAPPAAWPDAPSVPAPVYLLLDAGTGQVLAADDADERRPVASTVKMLTALTVAERTEMDDVIEVGPEVEGVVGASVDLEPGERWTVQQLLVGLLVRSGNDAAEAVATAVGGDGDGFLELMAEDAAALGLRVGGPDGVIVTSPSGLDDEQRLSARDLATLGRALLADAELRAIVGAPEVTLPGVGTDENRNLLVGAYAGATGIKTGFTEAAGNSVVASAERDGRELIAVVLGAGPDPDRFVAATALLDHGFSAFATTELSSELTLLVAGGQRQLEVDPTVLTAPAGADVALDVPLPVRAPEAGSLPVPVRVDGTSVATATATVTGDGPARTEGAALLGRAVVDGVYAAMRAGHDGDRRS
jgi:serine-type D-Ala-D-Ala carboxypeptidase (penicillin-binding protein 5/6)